MQQFLLDNFQRYHKRGMDAYRRGDMLTARVSLLKASELLFKLAAGSSGELQKVRKEKARKLLDLARSIDPTAPPRQPSVRPALPRHARRAASSPMASSGSSPPFPRSASATSPGSRMSSPSSATA